MPGVGHRSRVAHDERGPQQPTAPAYQSGKPDRGDGRGRDDSSYLEEYP